MYFSWFHNNNNNSTIHWITSLFDTSNLFQCQNSPAILSILVKLVMFNSVDTMLERCFIQLCYSSISILKLITVFWPPIYIHEGDKILEAIMQSIYCRLNQHLWYSVNKISKNFTKIGITTGCCIELHYIVWVYLINR